MRATIIHSIPLVFLLGDVRVVAAQEFTIPVVVHILHQNGEENISDEQVMSALTRLNEAFMEEGTATGQPKYTPLVADMDVAFCLANVDPFGEPTTGIIRTETPLTLEGGSSGSYIDQWPPEHYLNIWVVRATSTFYSSVALLPSEVETTPEKDGIMLLHHHFGTLGTVQYSAYHSAVVYAAGRYLGLKRLWEDPTGNGDCGDDGIADTPPCELLEDCPFDLPSCEPGLMTMVGNYMTYSLCSQMFTLGQKAKVHATLTSPVAGRDQLSIPATQASTHCGPLTTGVRERDRQFGAYPNPFSSRLCFSQERNEMVDLDLFASDGSNVMHLGGLWISGSSTCVAIPVDLPSGVFILKATSADQVRTSLVLHE